MMVTTKVRVAHVGFLRHGDNPVPGPFSRLRIDAQFFVFHNVFFSFLLLDILLFHEFLLSVVVVVLVVRMVVVIVNIVIVNIVIVAVLLHRGIGIGIVIVIVIDSGNGVVARNRGSHRHGGRNNARGRLRSRRRSRRRCRGVVRHHGSSYRGPGHHRCGLLELNLMLLELILLILILILILLLLILILLLSLWLVSPRYRKFGNPWLVGQNLALDPIQRNGIRNRRWRRRFVRGCWL
mmetsp:Transcript_27417/g.64256  ORF Transcript_27417/g.64256 Transcript_27417/m.64256 type:complete len:237 (-) Transcript_27417:9-719(-)